MINSVDMNSLLSFNRNETFSLLISQVFRSTSHKFEFCDVFNKSESECKDNDKEVLVERLRLFMAISIFTLNLKPPGNRKKMPLNPIVPSLVLYFELDHHELLQLNDIYPNFLSKELVDFGYGTLHLMPETVKDPFEEFISWPKEDRDLVYFCMTQKRNAAVVKIIPTDEEGKDFGIELESGVITVMKFKTVREFIAKAKGLAETPNCCFTVLFTINKVPSDSLTIKEYQKLLNYQLSLNLKPSSLINCPNPDWTRFSVSFSKGSQGEFRIRKDSSGFGLFDLSKLDNFSGGWTQLYSLKAELSYVIGVTGKYGD